MKLLTKKRVLIGILVVLVLLISYLVYDNYYIFKQAPIGAGVKAKILSSGIFVSKRDAQSVLDEDLSFHSLLGLVKTKIDYEKKSVTATMLGFIKKRAIYREGLGCILMLGVSEEEIKSWPVDIPEPLPMNPEEVPWPSGDLQLEEDRPQNVNQLLLDEALDNVFSEPDQENLRRTRAVVVVYDGRLIAERYAAGFTKDTPLIGWSMTKSVTSALVGILVGQGKLSIYEPAPVPEWREPGDSRNAITIDQLLRMSSGLKFMEEYEKNPLSDVNIMLFLKPDSAAYAVNMPLDAEPDEKWHYSSGTTNIISRIIRHTIGNQVDYFAFPRQALFNRIGMRSAILEPDASGNLLCSSNLYASARDWARFGLLYLQDGIWEGKRILPEGWVEYTTTPTPNAPVGEYGAQFWLNKGNPADPKKRLYPRLPTDLFCLQGYQGQNVIIIPSRKLVVVRLGMTHKGGWGLESFMVDILKTISASE